jgi:hypothetical protein
MAEEESHLGSENIHLPPVLTLRFEYSAPQTRASPRHGETGEKDISMILVRDELGRERVPDVLIGWNDANVAGAPAPHATWTKQAVAFVFAASNASKCSSDADSQLATSPITLNNASGLVASSAFRWDATTRYVQAVS